jgi:hypothetical protein
MMFALMFVLAALYQSDGRAAQAPQPQPARLAQVVALEQSIAGKEQLPAEQVFKNIQTFKGMPAIRVLRIMEMAFVPNLGVECTYCHVDGHWESDEKRPKTVTRSMWTLRADVQEQVRTITGKADVPVTCYTCHKGSPKPAFAPPPSTERAAGR